VRIIGYIFKQLIFNECKNIVNINQCRYMPQKAKNQGLKIRVSLVRFRDWPPELPKKPALMGWLFCVCAQHGRTPAGASPAMS
jgi:hypothetical protein